MLFRSCVSVTHEALGTVRVMRTCGMMGEVVGKDDKINALQDEIEKDLTLVGATAIEDKL